MRRWLGALAVLPCLLLTTPAAAAETPAPPYRADVTDGCGDEVLVRLVNDSPTPADLTVTWPDGALQQVSVPPLGEATVQRDVREGAPFDTAVTTLADQDVAATWLYADCFPVTATIDPGCTGPVLVDVDARTSRQDVAVLVTAPGQAPVEHAAKPGAVTRLEVPRGAGGTVTVSDASGVLAEATVPASCPAADPAPVEPVAPAAAPAPRPVARPAARPQVAVLGVRIAADGTAAAAPQLPRTGPFSPVLALLGAGLAVTGAALTGAARLSAARRARA